MAETAKELAGDATPTTEKGRAKKKTTEKAEKVAKARKSAKGAGAEAETPSVKAKAKVDSQNVDEEALTSIREQIENCKNELCMSLRLGITEDYDAIVKGQLASAERRRRWNNFFHDVIIIIVVFVAVYFWFCLCDARYFDFMKMACERDNTCQTQVEAATETAGPVKDANWYLANYGYLFDDLQTELDADNLAAYYLYSDDRKVGQIGPEYLLSMAFNRANVTVGTEQTTVSITADVMKAAFEDMFGSLEAYAAVDFTHGCLEFKYTQSTKTFVAQNKSCEATSRREIVEEIDRIYEEGEALYVLTTAAIRDRDEQNLYNFDNLFQPVVLNAADDLSLYSASLNRYQYQFKKQGQEYHFASITKLR